jgi:putative ABC transport system permease protein
MDHLGRDLRFAVRSLLKRPAMFGIATVSLALGIAANTTIFAAVDGLMIRPLPYPDAGRILQLWTSNPARGWHRVGTSVPDYLDWRREIKSMELGAFTIANVNLAESERPERAQRGRVTASFFTVMGTAPLFGRTFLADEEKPGAPKTAVIGYALWTRRFAGNPSALGKVIMLNGEPHTIVGIMPKTFRFPTPSTDLWTPITHDGTEKRGDRALALVGRLRAGVAEQAGLGELGTIAARLAGEYDEDRGDGVVGETLQSSLLGPEFYRGATVSMVAVVFVLLIACANVANLLLARGTGRARELALRTAIGASRARLVRQLLTESVMLALVGGALGVVLSIWGIRAFVSIIPTNVPGVDRIALNARALAYTVGVCLIAGIAFGVAPALRATSVGISSVLREGGRTATMGLRRNRLGASLVVSEIALALALLISAGLLIKGAIRVQTVDLGFEPDHLLTVRMMLPENQYADTTRLLAVEGQMLAHLAALPGVESVGATSILPTQGGSATTYAVEGRPKPETSKAPYAQLRVITPGYLKTTRYRLVRGREFTAEDRLGRTNVTLVNETFARKLWPNTEAIGKRIIIDAATGETPCEIVGIVADVREFGPDSDIPDMMYFAAWQRPQRALSFVLRSTSDPAALANAVRAQLAAVDPTIPAFAVKTMSELIDLAEQANMIMPRLLAVFGALALVLAIVGVYGVMSYSVSQRTHEVGVRMALGAGKGDVLRLVLRQGATLALAGLAIGLGLAALTTRTLSFFLLGVSAFDPAVFTCVSLALAGAAFAASIVPAIRALRVDPLIALRHE